VTRKTLTFKGGRGACDRCGDEGELACGVCASCADALHAWTGEAAVARVAQLGQDGQAASTGESLNPATGTVTLNVAAFAKTVAEYLRECGVHERLGPATTPVQTHGTEVVTGELVIELDEDDGTVLTLTDDDAFDATLTPEELRAALRGAAVAALGEIVATETTAALNRARGRVD
jgi:hypothetical protein